MNARLSYCGIDCSACPTYRATQADDDAKRAKVAAFWSRMFGTEIAPSDINCDGCRKDGGRLFGHCRTCAVRLCARDRALASCGRCGEYSCDKLDGLLALLPMEEPRKNLDAIRQGSMDPL
ncbi:MAG TPA: DUF3795 domain-containing protein [Deltaproteobacteria bacterium]|nr:DUF3795 domain-containing protein [Deltaproteobacteria bacterium]HQI82260.1 DUF3795 domain-containing protein [Deltaproteobacteria bacterium]